MRVIAADERARIERRLRWLAWAMDSAYVVPGTNFRFGWDAIIGVMPGAGDVVGAAVSIYIVYEGARLGASRWTLARMVLNVAIDAGVGAVPILGDLFDAAWKANVKNLRLLGITPEDPHGGGRKVVRNEAEAGGAI
jgi:hypothetical protein